LGGVPRLPCRLSGKNKQANETNMNTKAGNISLELKRLINAPRESVFKAWTDPEQIKQWFIPDSETAIRSVKADPRVGGKFRIQTQRPDGEFFTAVGTYREVKPPERLVFTWAWEKDGSEADFGEVEPNETQVTLQFLEHGKQTMLVLTHENFDSVERRDRHAGGWGGCLDTFEKLFRHPA
jgi:uncharacterized protein YndB with AHSA1/START domain